MLPSWSYNYKLW